MVQFSALLLLLPTLVTTYATALPQKRSSTQDIITDIHSLSGQVAAVNDSFTAFPFVGGTPDQVANLHEELEQLSVAFQLSAGITIAGTPPLSESDGQLVITSLASNTSAPKCMTDALAAIQFKKIAFEAFPFVDQRLSFLNDLVQLNTTTLSFIDALLGIMPADVVNQAQLPGLRLDIVQAFQSVITSFSQV